MAVQEVSKHTKKAFVALGGKKGFWYKVGDFALEIIIIVFAVSLSIYLHDRSVKKHQDHETKAFLLGLKEDLKTDIKEMNDDKASFQRSGKSFDYIISRKLNEKFNKDSLRSYSRWIFNTTGLVPNSGRFEGFKSSGKIGTISNKELQNNIMELYQESIPNVILSTNTYTGNKQRLFNHLGSSFKRTTDSTDNLIEMMSTDEVFYICRGLTFIDEIISRYDTCIVKMSAIIKAIEEEYEK